MFAVDTEGATSRWGWMIVVRVEGDLARVSTYTHNPMPTGFDALSASMRSLGAGSTSVCVIEEE